jgi:hypothetical protein
LKNVIARYLLNLYKSIFSAKWTQIPLLSVRVCTRFVGLFKAKMISVVKYLTQSINGRYKKILIVALLAFFILSISLISSFGIQRDFQASNITKLSLGLNITGNFFGIYDDVNCVTQVSEISWGILSPGMSATNTFYVRNEGDCNIILLLETSDWSPTNAPNYMTLSWDYAGEQLVPNQVIEITLTLSVSENIEGIENFSFNTIIGCELFGQQKDVFLVVRKLDNRIYYRTLSNNVWGDWKDVPGGTVFGTPGAVVYDDKLYMVVQSTDGNSFLFGSIDLSDDSFSGWSYLSGATLSKPTLVCWENSERLVLVVRGIDNRIYHRQYNLVTESWGSWNAVPTGSTVDSPAAAIDGNYLHLVVRGMDNSLYHKRVYLPTLNYLGWTQISGTTPSAPTLVSNYRTEGDDHLLYLIVRGSDNGIYLRSYTGGWSSWSNLPGGTKNEVGACIESSKPDPFATLHLVVTGLTGGLYHGKYGLNSESFLGWSFISGDTPSSPILTS